MVPSSKLSYLYQINTEVALLGKIHKSLNLYLEDLNYNAIDKKTIEEMQTELRKIYAKLKGYGSDPEISKILMILKEIIQTLASAISIYEDPSSSSGRRLFYKEVESLNPKLPTLIGDLKKLADVRV